LSTADRNENTKIVIMVDLLSKGASLPDEQQNIRLRRTVNQLTRATLKPFSDNGLRLLEPGGHKNR